MIAHGRQIEFTLSQPPRGQKSEPRAHDILPMEREKLKHCNANFPYSKHIKFTEENTTHTFLPMRLCLKIELIII
jgi:hypothetical protein